MTQEAPHKAPNAGAAAHLLQRQDILAKGTLRVCGHRGGGGRGRNGQDVGCRATQGPPAMLGPRTSLHTGTAPNGRT